MKETDMEIKLRLATDDDRDQVIAILNHYIENSMAAYPEHPMPPEAWDKMKGMCVKGNLWVAEDAGKVIGFAMLKVYMGRDTFAHTSDVGYFLLPEYTGRGLGRLIMDKLEEVARSIGITVLVADVSSLNPASLAFHRKMGFTECGRIPGVGIKKGQPFDIVWFVKNI
jgi:phosphinothricin acetyltransferase